MNNAITEHTAVLAQRWMDILPPEPASPASPWLLISSGLLLFMVIIVVFVLWQQRPRQRAQRVLRRSGRQLQAGPEDSRRIAHTVYHAIMQGLGLSPARALSHSREADRQWQVFYQQLQQCVFQAVPPAVDELAELIHQGRYWLRHYPR